MFGLYWYCKDSTTVRTVPAFVAGLSGVCTQVSKIVRISPYHLSFLRYKHFLLNNKTARKIHTKHGVEWRPVPINAFVENHQSKIDLGLCFSLQGVHVPHQSDEIHKAYTCVSQTKSSDQNYVWKSNI